MRKGFATLLASLILLALSAFPAAAATVITRGPYIQNLTTQSVTIVWRTNRVTDSVVEYGTDVNLELLCANSSRSQDHAVTLTGLAAGTTYTYRVRSNGIVLAPPATFRTANPESDTSFNFVSFGDTGSVQHADKQAAVAAVAAGLQPRFLLQNGHINNPEGKWESMDAMVFRPYADMLRSIPIWPVLSDHDYLTDNGAPYFSAFHLPANNREKSEKYYSFDYGNAQFIALDVETDMHPGSPQYLFLVNELLHNRREWNFVFIHGAPYSGSQWGPADRGHNIRDELTPVFERYGVDMVFCGAKHHYQRFNPITQREVDPVHGVTYIVTGGGGQNVTPVWDVRLSVFEESVHHLTHVTIDGNQLQLDAYRHDGSLLDSHTMTSRPWTGPRHPVAAEDLILHLPFDDDDGNLVRDKSVHGHTGYFGWSENSERADAVLDRDNVMSGSGSLYCDGNEGPRYVTIPNEFGLFDPGDGFTMMAWTKTEHSSSWANVMSGGRFEYSLYLTTSLKSRAHLRDFVPTTTDTSGLGIVDGSWGHVAMVYDGGTVSLYVNGVLDHSSVHTGAFSGAIPKIRVGWDGYRGDQFAGWIDEVKVYRRALSPDEVADAMHDSLVALEVPAVATAEPRVPADLDDLICELSFDESGGQTVFDSSPAGNDGQLGRGSTSDSGDPTRIDSGKFGAGALRFDGSDDHVRVPDTNGDFDLDEEWTSMAWVQVDELHPWSTILCGGNYGYALYVDTDGSLRSYTKDMLPISAGNSRKKLLPGTWYHVAQVRRDNMLILYVDGKRERVTTIESGSVRPVNLYRIGYDGYGRDFLAGTVDEVKIYRKALNITEVRAEMTGTFGRPYTTGGEPPPPPPPPADVDPVLHLKMDEGADQVLVDHSGGNRDGFLGNEITADAMDPARGPGVDGAGSIEFDGALRYASVPDADGTFDLDRDMTVMCWVRPDQLQPWTPLVCGGEYAYCVYLTKYGRVRGYSRDLTPRATPTGVGFCPPGVWSHVAIVKDGSTIRVYVDGARLSTTTHSGSIREVGRIRVGYDGLFRGGFRGGIDDVRVFDEALSDAQVIAEMQD